METRARLLLLNLAVALLAGCAFMRAQRQTTPPRQRRLGTAPAKQGEEEPSDRPPRVVEPEVARRKIKVPKIDAKNIELGGYYGSLSIEDFGTNAVWGLNAAYHVTEDFFFRAVTAAHGRQDQLRDSWRQRAAAYSG